MDETEALVSDWVAEGEDSVIEGAEGEGESGEDGVFNEREEVEEQFVEPPEDAKLFVGNLPYDVDSEKLAMLFEQVGTVEIAEVKFGAFDFFKICALGFRWCWDYGEVMICVCAFGFAYVLVGYIQQGD